MQLSRRKRLIERHEPAYGTSPASAQPFPTRTFADPVNEFAYATPPQGVQNPQGTPFRSTTGVYAGAAPGAFGPTTHPFGGTFNAYNVASGHAYDATQANKAYNAYGTDRFNKTAAYRPGNR